MGIATLGSLVSWRPSVFQFEKEKKLSLSNLKWYIINSKQKQDSI
jgi:hypothetical protein